MALPTNFLVVLGELLTAADSVVLETLQ